VAIELTDELIRLQRTANAAREEATAGAYSAEAWRPWSEAVGVVQAAVTEHAKETGQSRYEVEMAVKLAAREAGA
jgi:pyrroloquinoline quinone (PQQ) biosynthesis protein C